MKYPKQASSKPKRTRPEYLTTLQSDLAITDFEKCLSLGVEKLDCLYRIGLAHYYA